MASKSEIEELFKLFDTDGSGFLTVDEVIAILVRPTKDGEPLSEAETTQAREMFGKWDKNGDGKISIREFSDAWSTPAEGGSGDDAANAMAATAMQATFRGKKGREQVACARAVAAGEPSVIAEKVKSHFLAPPEDVRATLMGMVSQMDAEQARTTVYDKQYEMLPIDKFLPEEAASLDQLKGEVNSLVKGDAAFLQQLYAMYIAGVGEDVPINVKVVAGDDDEVSVIVTLDADPPQVLVRVHENENEQVSVTVDLV